ncbi:MAG: mechanosensitive ion channel [Porticoccaceae bacterium]|nr:mechanosensitive ion channel [Pseudomonadales bacterium]MCP5171220.1 mechanosensitive ion channel [Pseudomonadales bacterium]MCP5301541.1 mechanosensitive ion channel [Pseudomonadales bacterium]
MKFLLIVGVLVTYLVCTASLSRLISSIGRSRDVVDYRITYINKTLNIAMSLVFLIVVFLVLGIEYSQVSLFLSSVFAVIGVALFAQWSILSNITASLIIFFAFPYRVGDKVRVVDKDDDISGVIEEISLFHVMIRKNGDLITYPNNMILQKAVIKISSEG